MGCWFHKTWKGNIGLAEDWLRKAAAQGDTDSQCLLARMLNEQNGCN